MCNAKETGANVWFGKNAPEVLKEVVMSAISTVENGNPQVNPFLDYFERLEPTPWDYPKHLQPETGWYLPVIVFDINTGGVDKYADHDGDYSTGPYGSFELMPESGGWASIALTIDAQHKREDVVRAIRKQADLLESYTDEEYDGLKPRYKERDDSGIPF